MGLNGKCKEIRPLCVLDFYIHESIQRGGYGKVRAFLYLSYLIRDYLKK
jgi:hypothetical protein